MVPLSIFHIFKIIEKQGLKAVVTSQIVEVGEDGSSVDLLKDYDMENKTAATIEQSTPKVACFYLENTYDDSGKPASHP